MHRRFLLATLALAGSTLGCSSEELTEEIWAFYLKAQITETDSENLSHNFDGAYQPSDASDWTSSADPEESQSIEYAEMVALGNGESLLVLRNRTYLGATTEQTTTWSWDRYSEGNSYESHEQGYAFTQDWNDHTLNQINLTQGDVDGVLTGDWTVTVTTDDVFQEDDTWDTALTGQTQSQLPAATYLVEEDDLGNETAVSNSSVDTDCTSSPCTLTVSTTLVLTRDVKAVLTDYTADDLDRNLEAAGQQAGN